jgi:hypothetical protein
VIHLSDRCPYESILTRGSEESIRCSLKRGHEGGHFLWLGDLGHPREHVDEPCVMREVTPTGQAVDIPARPWRWREAAQRCRSLCELIAPGEGAADFALAAQACDREAERGAAQLGDPNASGIPENLCLNVRPATDGSPALVCIRPKWHAGYVHETIRLAPGDQHLIYESWPVAGGPS